MVSMRFLSEYVVGGKLGTLIMGFAALFATGTQANTSSAVSAPTLGPSIPSESRKQRELVIRGDGEKVQLSEDGHRFEDLTFDDSLESARVKELLRRLDLRDDSVSIPVGRIIVACGGAGAHYATRSERANEAKTNKEK